MPRKKLELLRSWFAKFGIPGEPRIMLITGPSGSGKSVAIRLIAAEANKRLLEWMKFIIVSFVRLSDFPL